MGADLIGYFAKGPKKLPRRAIPAAITEADHRLGWLRRARRIVKSSNGAALEKFVRACPWYANQPSHEEAGGPAIEQSRGEVEHLLDLAGDIKDLTGEEAVREFMQSWPPRFRDTAHVVDPDCPDKLIVFAGERTWGDPPDGEGFKLLTRAGVLGIAPILGVWVETAFITIRIPLPERNNHDQHS